MAPTDESGQATRHASPTGTTPPPGPPPGGPAGPGARMPRWLPRAMVLALALIAVFQLGSWAVHQLTGLLINVLIAFFLALAIEPAVSWMAGRGLRRGLATFLVFIAVLIAAAGFVTLLGSMLAGQIVKMVEDFPDYLDSVISWVNGHFYTELRRVDIQEGLLRSDWLRNYVQNSATGVLDVGPGPRWPLPDADGPAVLVLLRRRRPPAAARAPLRPAARPAGRGPARVGDRRGQDRRLPVLARSDGAGLRHSALHPAGDPGGALRPRARGAGGSGVAVHPHHRHLSRGRPAHADRLHGQPLVRAVGTRSSW